MVKTTCVIQTPVHSKQKYGFQVCPINTELVLAAPVPKNNTQHKGGRTETGYSHGQSPCELL